jgi:hypothetical protein
VRDFDLILSKNYNFGITLEMATRKRCACYEKYINYHHPLPDALRLTLNEVDIGKTLPSEHVTGSSSGSVTFKICNKVSAVWPSPTVSGFIGGLRVGPFNYTGIIRENNRVFMKIHILQCII